MIVAISPQAEGNISAAIVLASPFTFWYAWYTYFARFREEPPRWRTHVTLAALILMTIGGLLFVPMTMLIPKDAIAPMGASLTVLRVAALCEALGFVVCFFGRARTVLPIAYSCFGEFVFLLMMSSMG